MEVWVGDGLDLYSAMPTIHTYIHVRSEYRVQSIGVGSCGMDLQLDLPSLLDDVHILRTWFSVFGKVVVPCTSYVLGRLVPSVTLASRLMMYRVS